MQITRDQYYAFTMPEDKMCPVWVEVFLTDGTHHVAPSPFLVMGSAVTYLQTAHPGTTVDELDNEKDLAEVREWARTMPLEQIPATQCPTCHAAGNGCGADGACIVWL